eukprot:symbB.v1.2.000590.t1/scaffold26.1/size418576/5
MLSGLLHCCQVDSEALSLKHLAAARGHQIRKLIFERSSSPYGLLKSIQTKPVDGKGYASIVWTVDEEVEYVVGGKSLVGWITR